MISLDLETTGVSPERHSILSIGAVDMNSDKEFYIETRAYSNREIDAIALQINGYTMEQATDPSKPLPHEGYLMLLKWVRENNLEPLLAGENMGSFDALFLRNIHDNYAALYPEEFGKWMFGYRFVDLHSVSYAKFGRSMKMDKTLEALGLPPEPRPHDALVGAKCAKMALQKLLEK